MQHLRHYPSTQDLGYLTSYLRLSAKQLMDNLKLGAYVCVSWLRCWTGDPLQGIPHGLPFHGSWGCSPTRCTWGWGCTHPLRTQSETAPHPHMKDTGSTEDHVPTSNRCTWENIFKKHYRIESLSQKIAGSWLALQLNHVYKYVIFL